MRYISTRGQAPALPFEEAFLSGLARDGGLYVPEELPVLDHRTLRSFIDLPYAEVAARIFSPFAPGIAVEDIFDMAASAYSRFDAPDVAPLKDLGDEKWLLELFNGPTLAFKDFALQWLGQLFEYVLERRGHRVNIVVATSGDTGSAAIEACRDRPALELYILHPKGRISEVQRRQMTTVLSANIHNIAIEGTFDDCQDLVKGMFNDLAFRDKMQLAAVNSINWARVMAQIIYYVTSAVGVGVINRKVTYSVPTGNFGCVYAGYLAKAMGVPISRLIVATNSNDILYRFFQDGEYRIGEVISTQSPSMDIQVASNFERLLFDVVDRSGDEVEAYMRELLCNRGFIVNERKMSMVRKTFDSTRVGEAATTATIRRMYEEKGILIDPHTAVAMRAAFSANSDTPVITLATAHPAKFPDAVYRATGTKVSLPKGLSDLHEKSERCIELPSDLATVQDYMIERKVGLDG